MAITAVANVIFASSGPDGGTSTAIDTRGANLFVAMLSQYHGGTTLGDVSDSKSNVWLPLTAYFHSANLSWVRLYYCVNPIIDAAHTFSTSGCVATYPVLAVNVYKGVASSPLDAQNGTNDGTSPINTGSVTPSVAGELLVAGVSHNGTTQSIDSSFAITNQASFSGGNHMGGAIADQIQTTATTRNPAWSGDQSLSSAAIATFKPSAVGSPWWYQLAGGAG